MDLICEIKLAEEWMREAQKLLQPYLHDPARRQAAAGFKDDGQLVTAADRAVSELIVARVREAFPGDAVCSEEGGDCDDARAARRWIIDPIDGTRSFMRGLPGFAVMVALSVDGTPVLGVVHDPLEQSTWIAAKSCGVSRNGARVKPNSRPPRLIWSPFAAPEGREAIGAALGVSGALNLESLGLRASVMAVDGTGVCGSRPNSPHIWDTAAAWVILNEIGATITDYDGKPLNYTGDTRHERGVVATLGLDHNQARSLMRAHLP